MFLRSQEIWIPVFYRL